MKIKIHAKENIYDAKVLSCKGGYVMIACNGNLRKEFNPALAQQFMKEHYGKKTQKKSQKKKTKTINTLPKELKALPNVPKDFFAEKPNLPSVVPARYRQDNINNCHNCMLQKSGECVGNTPACEFYRHCPQETEYARERRLAI